MTGITMFMLIFRATDTTKYQKETKMSITVFGLEVSADTLR